MEEEIKSESEKEEEEKEKPIEMINFGFFEACQVSTKVLSKDSLPEKRKTKAENEVFHRNNRKVEFGSTTVGSLLISAINHVCNSTPTQASENEIEEMFEDELLHLERVASTDNIPQLGYNGPIIGEEIRNPYHLLFEELDRVQI